MIQILVGLLSGAAGAALMFGLGDHVIPVAPARSAGADALLTFGLIMIGHGAFRLLREREAGDRHWTRSLGLAGVILLVWATFALAIPSIVATLNVITVGGFPMGYYMAAQGSLIAIVIVLFLFARRQDLIDVEEGVAEEPGSVWRGVERS